MKIIYELEKGAMPPVKKHETDAGLDLTWYVPDFDLHLRVDDPDLYWSERDRAFAESREVGGGLKLLRTGVHVLIPDGYVGLVLPRSSSPVEIHKTGVIDSGYTGEIFVQWNNTVWRVYEKYEADIPEPFDRIAQLVILPCPYFNLIQGEVIGVDTSRGDNGFGSTGK